jgi:hypothetical protein
LIWVGIKIAYQFPIPNNTFRFFIGFISTLNLDTKIYKDFIFKTDFSIYSINDFSDNIQNYTLQNLYIGYLKPNSKFSYSMNFRNIDNNGVIIRNTFSDNLLVSNQVFTLPRVLLLELKYKF